MPSAAQILNAHDHSRDAAGLSYVYPVVSRRAGGVSIGINLNINNACNWRCIYCQVPDLQRGGPPPVDTVRLDVELRGFLHEVLHGDFMRQRVPPEARRLNDIALSGNGEPTSAREFAQVVMSIGKVMRDFDLLGKIKLVLITNGSLVGRAEVQEGLRLMARLNGEVWFKLDRATAEGMQLVNNVRLGPEQALKNLARATSLCPTWLQTCMFQIDGQPPSDGERAAYLQFLAEVKQRNLPLRGVLLYGLARLSLQPEAGRLSALPADWLHALAHDIEAFDFPVKLCA
jgi:wyosine [tRNA(Phe)-imidazoG37] synthetase (radical SAM superfamily)